MSINIKDAEEKLGKDKIQEIVEKEWKVVEPPTEEELAKEEVKHPKARNNPNSRKNLIQYNKKTKEQKEKMVKNLQFVEVEEDINPHDVLENPHTIDIIDKMMPAKEVLSDRKEQEVYYNYIKLILKDFNDAELTSSDLDDIVTLALNKIIEYRILKKASKNPLLLLEASSTLEKFRKFSERIKSGLASRRIDRIDVKNKPTFSIVDLAAEIDEENKNEFDRRIKEMEETRETYVPPRRNEDGYITDDE